MKKPNKVKEFLIDTIVFILGGALFSVSINCFLAHNNILNGGFTGLATVINHLWSFIPIGTALFVMNIPLFLLAFRKLGTRFVLRTGWATLILSTLIDIGVLLPRYSGDLLLASLFGGALMGVALGIIFLRNATTGGADIIAKLVKLKYPQVSLGRAMLVFDAVIVLLGGVVYRNIESMLYAAVVIFVCSQVIDYVIYGASRGAMLMIITEKSEEVRNMLIYECDRGVTLLKGQGGYSGDEKNVILCACYDNQAQKFIKKVKAIDEKAFFIVTQSKQILGEGFNKSI